MSGMDIIREALSNFDGHGTQAERVLAYNAALVALAELVAERDVAREGWDTERLRADERLDALQAAEARVRHSGPVRIPVHHRKMSVVPYCTDLYDEYDGCMCLVFLDEDDRHGHGWRPCPETVCERADHHHDITELTPIAPVTPDVMRPFPGKAPCTTRPGFEARRCPSCGCVEPRHFKDCGE